MSIESDSFLHNISKLVKIRVVPDFSLHSLPWSTEDHRQELNSATALGFYRWADETIYLLDPPTRSVIFHELIHWIRSPYVMSIDTWLKKAVEEVAAHTGAKILCARFDVEFDEKSQSFERVWRDYLAEVVDVSYRYLEPSIRVDILRKHFEATNQYAWEATDELIRRSVQ
jgi:hypothetical protein